MHWNLPILSKSKNQSCQSLNSQNPEFIPDSPKNHQDSNKNQMVRYTWSFTKLPWLEDTHSGCIWTRHLGVAGAYMDINWKKIQERLNSVYSNIIIYKNNTKEDLMSPWKRLIMVHICHSNTPKELYLRSRAVYCLYNIILPSTINVHFSEHHSGGCKWHKIVFHSILKSCSTGNRSY